MLVELAAGLRVARGLEIAFGFAAAMQKTIGPRALLLALPFRPFARFTKFDDVTHPRLGHQACEACSVESEAFSVEFLLVNPKCARSVAINDDRRAILAA
jgi:hypothetical protein